MLQMSALQAKLDDKKHGQEVADSWVAQLQEQLKVEKDALNRKDREMGNLVEQLEQFREDLVDKEEEIQRLHMEIQIQHREMTAHTDGEQHTAQLLEENSNLKSALKTLQDQAEEDLSMPRYAQDLLEEKNCEIDHLNEEIKRLREDMDQMPSISETDTTSTASQTEDTSMEDEADWSSVLEQKEEDISALRVELLNMRNRDPLQEPVVQHAMERNNQEFEQAKAQLQEDIRQIEDQLRTQQTETESLKQQLLGDQTTETAEREKSDAEELRTAALEQQAAAEEAEAAAQRERAEAEQEKLAAQQERAAAEQERAAAEQEKLAAQQERAAAEETEAAAQRERAAAEQEWVAAEQEKLAAQQERAAAEEAKAAAQQEKTAAEEQKIAAQQEKAAAEEQKIAAQQEKAAAEEQKIAAQQEKTAAEEAKTAAQQEKAAAEEQKIAAQQERAAAEEARSAAKQETTGTEEAKAGMKELSAPSERLSDQELMKKNEELRQLQEVSSQLQAQLENTEKQLINRDKEVSKLEEKVSSLLRLQSEDVQVDAAVRQRQEDGPVGSNDYRVTDDRMAELQAELTSQAQRHEEEVVLLKSSLQTEMERVKEQLREEYRTRLENIRVSTQGSALKQKLDEIRAELTWQHQQHIRDIQENAERDAQMRVEELELRHRQHIEELQSQYGRVQMPGVSEADRLQTDLLYRLDTQHGPGTETGSSTRASPTMYTPAGSELGHRLQDEIDATERLDNNLVNQLRQRQQGVGQDHSDSEVDDIVSTRLEGLLRRLHTEGSKVLSLSELQFIQQHSMSARPPVPDGAERDTLQQSVKQQVELLEYKLNQEKTMVEDLQSSLLSERKRNGELVSTVEEERRAVSCLQNELSSLKMLVESLRAALDREQTKLASVSGALESEKAHVKSLLEALEIERHAVQQLQDEVDADRDQSLDQQHRDGQVIKKLKEGLALEQGKSAELSRSLEDEKLRLISLQRELEKERENKTGVVQEKDFKLQELMKKLDRETTRADTVTAALEKQQSVAKQLQLSLEELKQTRADLERRKEASISELQSLLDAEKEHSLDLKTTLDRERQVAASLRQSITKERTKMSEELERERSLRNQLKNTVEKMERQSREASASLQQEKTNTVQLQAERDRLQAKLAVLADREAATERQRQKDKQSLQQKEKEIQQQQQKIAELQQQQKSQADRLGGGESTTGREKETRGVSPRSHHYSPEALTRHKQQLASLCQSLQLQLLRLKETLPSHAHSVDAELSKIEEIQQAVKGLSNELQHMRSANLSGSEPTTGPSVNEKILQQNTELTSFVARLSQEKAELRNALADLEEQVWMYRQKDSTANQISVPQKPAEPQSSSWQQEKAELLYSLQEAQSEVARLRAEGRQLVQEVQTEPHQTDSSVDHVKMQHMYGRYLRAESFRKALVYQKKYLLLLLGGFQDCEEATLALIAKMGAYPSSADIQRRSRHSKAFTRFRSAACVIIAVWRLQFLVQKWKRATRIGSPILNKSMSRTRDGGQHSRSLPTNDGQYNRSALPSGRQHYSTVPQQDGQRHTRLSSPAGRNSSGQSPSDGQFLSRRSPGSQYQSSAQPGHMYSQPAAQQHRSPSTSPVGSNLRFGVTRYSPPRPHLAHQSPNSAERTDDNSLTDYIHRLESLQRRLGNPPNGGSRK
ncbi:A-kinase anchor protein 9-like [Branchiostoma floridae]|uniref:A-kinase anchor protein 9-like n=1 Tax=Branchiostoma floridae TaxID=7739 RepID=A0A9J7LTW4_BRAFL|nr:A-kinase anchor protein 9-like [Branchiostoma floridae]